MAVHNITRIVPIKVEWRTELRTGRCAKLHHRACAYRARARIRPAAAGPSIQHALQKIWISLIEAGLRMAKTRLKIKVAEHNLRLILEGRAPCLCAGTDERMHACKLQAGEMHADPPNFGTRNLAQELLSECRRAGKRVPFDPLPEPVKPVNLRPRGHFGGGR